MSRRKLKTDSSIAGLRRLAAAHRALDDRAIFVTYRLAGREISAVNRETGNRFAHRARRAHRA